MAGFLGKFLLLKSILPLGATDRSYYVLLAVAIFGVVVSIYYYFGVIRAMYWGTEAATPPPREPVGWAVRVALILCVAGMAWSGLLPNHLLQAATPAVDVLRPQAAPAPATVAAVVTER